MSSILIYNGRIVDGSGSPGFKGDVLIEDDRIAAVGRITNTGADMKIDAKKRVVCPGFFDMHSHSEYSLLVDGDGISKVHQGITTEVTGESTSPAPLKGLALTETRLRLRQFGIEPTWKTLGEYFQKLEESGMSVNLVSYVGHSTVRQCVFGNEQRPPTDTELREMKRLIVEAMDDGAFGLSSSLSHPPGNYADTHEFTELCKEVASRSGIYTRHLRDEGDHILEAVQELIEVGRASRCPIEIFHLKVAGERNWHVLTPKVLSTIEEARSEGVDITASQYPYEYGSAGLANCMPYWSRQGGTGEMVKRLGDQGTRERIKEELESGWPGSWFKETSGGWEGVIVSTVVTEKNREIQGKSIAEIGRIRGVSPADAYFDILVEEGGTVISMYHWMSPEDISTIMQKPWVSFCTDGYAVRPEGLLGKDHPHPRYYGTFPRILGRYVRQRNLLTLDEAIRKATYQGASRLGIHDRGLIKRGLYADIVIFDPDTVIDTATYQDPHQLPVGIDWVIVNGRIVVEKGRHTGSRPGRVLRSYQRSK